MYWINANSVGFIVFIVLVIIRIAMALWYALKCRGIKKCENGKCLYELIFDCKHYRDTITEEEAKALLEYLDCLIPETRENKTTET